MGVRTSAKTPKGSADSFWSIGTAKQAVFPLPVWAQPSRFFPENIEGSVSIWIYVGLVIPTDSRFLHSQFSTRRTLKELGFDYCSIVNSYYC